MAPELEDQADFININMEDVDDGSDPVPAGLQLCRIKSTVKKHKEGSEYPYLDVRLSPLEAGDKFKNRLLFLTLSYHPNALWNMKRFMKKARIPFDANGFSVRDFPGREVYVTVKHSPDQNDPTAIRAEVNPPYAEAK
jgi:hypothetical protein